MCDVAHHSMHRPREIDLVLIVHGHADEQFGVSHGIPDILT